MANKYCNLVGTNLIKDEFGKINTGFDMVETDLKGVLRDGGDVLTGIWAFKEDSYYIFHNVLSIFAMAEGSSYVCAIHTKIPYNKRFMGLITIEGYQWLYNDYLPCSFTFSVNAMSAYAAAAHSNGPNQPLIKLQPINGFVTITLSNINLNAKIKVFQNGNTGFDYIKDWSYDKRILTTDLPTESIKIVPYK